MNESRQDFFVCIVRCADGVYYVGSTPELPVRVETHNSGRGPRFAACRRPVALVYSERFDMIEEARQREIQVKKWSRGKKEALIAGDMRLLHQLSRRHTGRWGGGEEERRRGLAVDFFPGRRNNAPETPLP